MKKLLLALFMLLSVGVFVAGAQKVQASGSPDGVVRELYRVHHNGKGGVFEAKGKKYIYKYFDQKLADLIWKDISETPEGDVGNLDFDPLYNAQDTQITNFLVGKPLTKDEESTVLVTFRIFGQGTSIKFEIHHSPEGWRIKNVIYGNKSDLVTLLSPHP